MAEHFTQETTDFMWGLAFNNEKPWFLEHKAEYEEYLKKPMNAVARAVWAEMDKAFPREHLQLHISRIYRDARRLHGRGPFKEHLWFSLKGSSGLLSGPMFWFEIGAKDFSWGMGYYDAPAELMQEHRRRIDEDPKAMEKLARALKKQDRFVLDGESYKRPKGDPGKLLFDWYNKKYISLTHSGYPGDELYDPRLAQRITEDFKWLMPYYKYFTAMHDKIV